MTTVEDLKAPDVETVKQLLIEDIPNIADTPNITNANESSFYEDDVHTDIKIRAIKTYSRTPTPRKRILQSIGNTLADECRSPKTPKRGLKSDQSLYDPNVLDSLIKRKRKKMDNQDENENISKITEQFKNVEKYQLVVE